MKTSVLLLSVCVTLLLVACGPATSIPATVEGIPRVTGTPQPANASTPTKGQESGNGLILVYERSGGIAGVQQVYEIHSDGRVVVKDNQQAEDSVLQVQADTVKDLTLAIERAGFFDLKDSYMPANTCCDRMTHRITVYRNGEAKTVTTMDGTENLPDSLTRVQAALATFLQAASKTTQ